MRQAALDYYTLVMASTNQPLTMADINRITMLKFCNDPDTLASVMLASAAADTENDTDGDCCKELLEFCVAEGIDPMPAIRKALEPSPIEKAFRRRTR